MKSILTAFSHVNLVRKLEDKADTNWAKPILRDEILKSTPKEVSTYDELVRDVAEILYQHRSLALFYRGQSSDHKDKNGHTTILPSIYRKKEKERRLLLKEKFHHLNECVQMLRKRFSDSKVKIAGASLINKYPEIGWSILQHYEVCPTPLVDITL